MPIADQRFVDQCLRMMTTLPRRKDDEVGGELRLRAYHLAIGDRPKAAMEFLVTEAIRTCKFFPSTMECIEILRRWERNDDAIRQRDRAREALRWDRQRRFDETMCALSFGDLDQAAIDALPVSWLEVAETRSYVRLEDGRYVSRIPRAAPVCRGEAA